MAWYLRVNQIYLRGWLSKAFRQSLSNIFKSLPQLMFWIWNKPKFDTFLVYALSEILATQLGKSENKKINYQPRIFFHFKNVQNFITLISFRYAHVTIISTCICTSCNPKILFVSIVNKWKLLLFLCYWM